jgi:hypothetical protein
MFIIAYNSHRNGITKVNSIDVFLVLSSWLVIFAVIYIWLKGDTK